MFRTWEDEHDPARGQRLASALLAAAVVLAGGFGFLLSLPPGALERKAEPAVVVAFRPPPPVVKKAVEVPKPLPPPPKVAKPKPPPVAAVVAPPPPAPAPAAAPMVAPRAVPTAKPPESKDVVPEKAMAVGGTGDGSGSGTGGPGEEAESPPPVVASAGSTGPVNLPEDAEPAEPSDDNAMPEYPESARSTGQEAVVVLKIVIESDGHVGKIQVMKGEEPFVSAATRAVRSWTYAPARLEGHAISIFKIIKLPFRLRDD